MLPSLVFFVSGECVLSCGFLVSRLRLLVFLRWQGPWFLLSGAELGGCDVPAVHDVTVLAQPGFAGRLMMVVGC
jgi:hypothetical protein